MVSRRRFLGSIAGAVAIAGFDPLARTWVSTAHAHHRDPFDRAPRLDGEIVQTPAVLEAFATDTGSSVHALPVAVLRPGSVEDIARMIRFCRRHHIVVAARGQGHTTFGQSLAGGGLVIDMSTLNAIHSIDSCSADVDAGATWRELVELSIPMGLVPPVLTGYIGLSFGGTLSVGGVSPGYDRGSQGDHVIELEVVTGEGDVVRCSEGRNRDLFLGCLAGLGQMGIITRVVTELVPAMERSRTYTALYFDNATFFADTRTLLDRNELDDLFCAFVPHPAGGWIYALQAIKFYDAAAPPDGAHLLRDLHFAAPLTETDESYLEHVRAVDLLIDGLKAAGQWDGVIHPWLDVWLPDRNVDAYIAEVLPTLGPDDLGPTGLMFLFPHRRSRFRRPFFRLPTDERVWLFDILTSNAVVGPDAAYERRMLDRNRSLYERARDLGGTRYPIGSIEFDRHDWIRQYGLSYLPFKLLQHRYDPDGILTPGVRI